MEAASLRVLPMWLEPTLLLSASQLPPVTRFLPDGVHGQSGAQLGLNTSYRAAEHSG